MLHDLQNGMTYKSVKRNNDTDYDAHFLQCLDSAFHSNDKLAKNYTIQSINRMKEYGYVYKNNPSDIVYMVGIEDFGNGCFRTESRLYVTEKYRSNYWRSPDNYETIIYQIGLHTNDAHLLFKSRAASNVAGFTISKRYSNYFSDWEIYPSKIELRYKNNIQWIMYKNIKGNLDDNVNSLIYKV